MATISDVLVVVRMAAKCPPTVPSVALLDVGAPGHGLRSVGDALRGRSCPGGGALNARLLQGLQSLLSSLVFDDEPVASGNALQLGADAVGEPVYCPMEQAGSPAACVDGCPCWTDCGVGGSHEPPGRSGRPLGHVARLGDGC